MINNKNKQPKFMAVGLEPDVRIEQFKQCEVFAAHKDHKVNFQNDSKCSVKSRVKKHKRYTIPIYS